MRKTTALPQNGNLFLPQPLRSDIVGFCTVSEAQEKAVARRSSRRYRKPRSRRMGRVLVAKPGEKEGSRKISYALRVATRLTLSAQVYTTTKLPSLSCKN